MPHSRLLVRDEMRMLGAVQIMTGVINNYLGLLWLYLFLSQSSILERVYLPITLMSGYPFWSSLCFIFSGTFAVVVEKKRSKFLMSYAIVLNIFSACLSLIGIWLLAFELSLFRTFPKSPWPQKSASLLSSYMCIFTILEFVVAVIVTDWTYKAKRGK